MKYKKGDVIKNKVTGNSIIITDCAYVYNDNSTTGCRFPVDALDNNSDWELVLKPKFKPGDILAHISSPSLVFIVKFIDNSKYQLSLSGTIDLAPSDISVVDAFYKKIGVAI